LNRIDKINVFAITLVKRKDRKANHISEFVGRDEFHLTIIPAMEHEDGWKILPVKYNVRLEIYYQEVN